MAPQVMAAVALLTNVGVLGGSLLLATLAGRGTGPGGERAALDSALLLGGSIMAISFLPALWLRSHPRERPTSA